MRAGQRADPHIDRARADAQRDAAVLRQALFGNVEFGHDFQARNQRRMQRPIRLHHVAQRAVDAKAHGGMALVGFDVDVAGTVAHRLRQQRVEHADDGRVVGGFEQVFNRRQRLHHARQIHIAFDFADDRGGAGFALRIGGADALLEQLGGFDVDVLHIEFAHHFTHAAGRARCGQAVQPQRQVTAKVFKQQLLAACKRIGQGVLGGVLHGLSVGRHRAGAVLKELLGGRCSYRQYRLHARQCGQYGRFIDRHQGAVQRLRLLLVGTHQVVTIHR